MSQLLVVLLDLVGVTEATLRTTIANMHPRLGLAVVSGAFAATINLNLTGLGHQKTFLRESQRVINILPAAAARTPLRKSHEKEISLTSLAT